MYQPFVVLFFFGLSTWALTTAELNSIVVRTELVHGPEKYKTTYRDGTVKFFGDDYLFQKYLKDGDTRADFYRKPSKSTFQNLSVEDKLKLAEYWSWRDLHHGINAPDKLKSVLLDYAKQVYENVPNDIKTDIQISSLKSGLRLCAIVDNTNCLEKAIGNAKRILASVAQISPNEMGRAACAAADFFEDWDPNLPPGDDSAQISFRQKRLEQLVLLEKESIEFQKNKNTVCTFPPDGTFSLADRFLAAKIKYNEEFKTSQPTATSPLKLGNFLQCNSRETLKFLKENHVILAKSPSGAKAFALINQKSCFVSFELEKLRLNNYKVQFRDAHYFPLGTPVKYSDVKELAITTYGTNILSVPEIQTILGISNLESNPPAASIK